MTAEFRPGDIVRSISDRVSSIIQAGEDYVVANCHDGWVGLEGIFGGFRADRFELAQAAKARAVHDELRAMYEEHPGITEQLKILCDVMELVAAGKVKSIGIALDMSDGNLGHSWTGDLRGLHFATAVLQRKLTETAHAADTVAA